MPKACLLVEHGENIPSEGEMKILYSGLACPSNPTDLVKISREIRFFCSLERTWWNYGVGFLDGKYHFKPLERILWGTKRAELPVAAEKGSSVSCKDSMKTATVHCSLALIMWDHSSGKGLLKNLLRNTQLWMCFDLGSTLLNCTEVPMLPSACSKWVGGSCLSWGAGMGWGGALGWCSSPAWPLKAVLWLLVVTFVCLSPLRTVVTILRTSKMPFVVLQ